MKERIGTRNNKPDQLLFRKTTNTSVGGGSRRNREPKLPCQGRVISRLGLSIASCIVRVLIDSGMLEGLAKTKQYASPTAISKTHPILVSAEVCETITKSKKNTLYRAGVFTIGVFSGFLSH